MKSLFKEYSLSLIRRNFKFLILLLSFLSLAQSRKTLTSITPTVLQTGIQVPNLTQTSRSYSFFSLKIQNRTLNSTVEKTVGVLTAIKIDINDQISDPDIYISATNLNPKSKEESDQYCLKAGSKVCILDNTVFQPNQIIYIGIKCMNKCKYNLNVVQPSAFTLSDGIQTTQYLDTFSVNIFQFNVPVNASDGLTSSVNFQAFTYSLTTPINLYLSPSKDFTQIEERDNNIVVDGGKGFKFTSDDFGWCVNCNIYLVISVNSAQNFVIQAKASARKELFIDQQQIVRQFNTLENQCFPYDIQKAVNDAMILVSSYQGDVEITSFYRNQTNNDTSNQVLLVSEQANQRLLIVRSQDRQRFGPANGLIYFCVQAYSPSTLQLMASQFFTYDRFDIQDNTLATFNLDSKDSIYFRYSSTNLQTSGNLTISVQSFNQIFNVPRVFYRICNFSDPEMCTLSELQQQGDKTVPQTLTELVGNVDNFKTRTAIINHNVSGCPVPSSCIYLISIFNSDLSGPLKTTFKVQPSSILEPTKIKLFQEYVDSLDYGSYQYFQLQLTPSQALKIKVQRLIVNVTFYNGKGEVFASNITKLPNNTQGFFQLRGGKSDFQMGQSSIAYDVIDGIIDIANRPIYFSVYGGVKSTYKIKFDAQYQLQSPSDFTNNTFDDSGNGNQDNQNSKVFINDGDVLDLNVDSVGTQAVINYQQQQEHLQEKNIFIYPTITNGPSNSALAYDIIYGDLIWQNVTGNQVISSDSYTYNQNLQFQFVFKGFFTKTIKKGSGKEAAAVADTLQTITFSLTVQSAAYDAKEIIETDLTIPSQYDNNDYYSAYASDSSQTIVFKQELLDSNGTYVFTINQISGQIKNMLYISTPNQPTFNADDDTTYYLQGEQNQDNQNQWSITLDKNKREQPDGNLCKNQSYSLKGGNNNCTMYVGIICDGFCIVQGSVTLTQATSRNISVPRLIRETSQFSGTMLRNRTHYFYLPFLRGKINSNFALVLNKLNDDSILVAKVISNGQLNYFNWSYPTNTSNDAISRSNKSNPIEILEISSTIINTKCLNNTSCILIVGVISNTFSNTSTSSYRFAFLSAQNRIQNESFFDGVFPNGNTYQYYWFMFSSTSTLQWRQLMTLKSNDPDKQINLYASVLTGSIPSQTSFDFKSDSLEATNVIQLSSDQQIFRSNRQLTRIIITIALYSLDDSASFQFYNYGPLPLTSTANPVRILQQNQTQNVTLPLGISPKNYVLFSYFSFGSRELKINITCLDGPVYYLANNLLFNEQDSNVYFKLPIINQTSAFKSRALNKGQSSIMQITRADGSDDTFESENNALYCQLCWYYIAIFSNNTNIKLRSRVSIKIDELNRREENLKIIRFGQPENIQIYEGDIIQRKFIFYSQDSFSLSVSNSNKGNFTSFVGLTQDFSVDEPIWLLQTNKTAQFSRIQTDPDFQIGQFYYLTILADVGLANITIALNQRYVVNLLKEKQTLQSEKMWTPDDYVKFYYFAPPKQPSNYSAIISITVKTPAFVPFVYAQRNDLFNGSTNFNNFIYPTAINNTFAFEQSYLTAISNSDALSTRTFNLTLNMTAQNITQLVQIQQQINVTLNRTVQKNETVMVYNKTTKRNQTVIQTKNVTEYYNATQNVTRNISVQTLNQTTYTIAIYWIKFGLSDFDKAQYDITLNSTLTPNLQRLQMRKQYKEAFMDSISQKIQNEMSIEIYDQENSPMFIQTISEL